jgi:hypothetical protein
MGGDDIVSRILNEKQFQLTDPATAGGAASLGPAVANAAAAAPAAGGAQGVLSSLFGRSGASSVLPLLLLGGSLLRGSSTPPAQAQVEALAKAAQGNAAGLTPTAIAELQGNLPGGLQASLDSALADTEATIRSNYANMNLTGSSMEAQDLARAKTDAWGKKVQLAQQLGTQGLQLASGYTGQAADLYSALMQEQLQKSQETTNALADFAGMLALGSYGQG